MSDTQSSPAAENSLPHVENKTATGAVATVIVLCPVSYTHLTLPTIYSV